MFGSHESPAMTSLLSLFLGVVAVLFAALYYTGAVTTGGSIMLIIGMMVAFLAVLSGMFFLSRPEPGILYALAGMGAGMAVIVLGFLAFLLDLALA